MVNNMLERHDLIQAFNNLKDYRVVAVCAPAGYGKTVAVTQWLNKDTRAKAIFSVDEYDNNLAGFCERFCTALQVCQPQNKTLAEIIAHEFFHNAPQEFAMRAVSTLSTRKPAVLTIDDLHLINNSEILQLLLIFIKRLPKNFQVVFISRNDLALGFSDLWIKGQAARVSAEQLLFTDNDIMNLFKKRGNEITERQANDISRQTHGWAIGVNAFLLSQKEPPDKVYRSLDDFIRLNIWEKWDEATRYFMLRTAALRDLTPLLCNSMTGMTDSGKFLKELVQKGAFTTQLPTGEYRYHHLFQQFLIRVIEERGEIFLQSLLETEGYWHLSNSDFYNAIECFVRSKNYNGIANCFNLLGTADLRNIVMSRILPILKCDGVQDAAKHHPHLLYLTSYCALADGRIYDTVSLMDEYYARHLEIVASNPARAYDIHYVRMMDFRIPLKRIIDEMEEPRDKSSITIDRWALSLQMPFLHRGMRDYSEMVYGDVAENIINWKQAKIGWLYGERTTLLDEIIITGLLYEQGNLQKAYEHALAANTMIINCEMPDTKFCAKFALVRVLDALGEVDEADEVLRSTFQMIEEDKSFHLYDNLNAFTARRKFVSGNTKTAEEWLATQMIDISTLWGIYADLTACRAFIAVKKYDRAIAMLNKILYMAIKFNRPMDAIEARILLAIAFWNKKYGFQKEAIKHLENAALEACNYGFTQMFINDGAQLAGMLSKLVNRVKQQSREDDKYLSFIKMLYLKTRDKTRVKDADMDNTKKYTDKQMVIMRLLCQGKTYKEMAAVLGVKHSTIRSHLVAVYNKFDVTNMADAVAKINAMGLLE